jgi:hypothetical protein
VRRHPHDAPEVGAHVRLVVVARLDGHLGKALPGPAQHVANWTVLRPSSFASNCLHWTPSIHSGQPVPNLTGDAEQGVIDPLDVAAVAVEALTDPAHAGQT